MKILIVGAGALGGYYGGRLLQAGRDVTFLLRPNRIDQLKITKGLIISSTYGDVSLSDPRYLLSSEIDTPFDLIIVSCKAYALSNCMESFAAAVGPNTMILPVLNGIQHIDALTSRFGKQHILGGYCIISATLDTVGRIQHLNKLHLLAFGELDGSVSPRIQRVKEQLSNATFEAKYSQHVLQEMWDKWVFIACAAGITCLMRAAICDIIQAQGEHYIIQLLEECSAIAHHNGFPLANNKLIELLKTLTDPKSELTASMLKDIEKSTQIESEAIIGDLLQKAPADQLNNFPILTLAYIHLKAYEARKQRTAL